MTFKVGDRVYCYNPKAIKSSINPIVGTIVKNRIYLVKSDRDGYEYRWCEKFISPLTKLHKALL